MASLRRFSASFCWFSPQCRAVCRNRPQCKWICLLSPQCKWICRDLAQCKACSVTVANFSKFSRTVADPSKHSRTVTNSSKRSRTVADPSKHSRTVTDPSKRSHAAAMADKPQPRGGLSRRAITYGDRSRWTAPARRFPNGEAWSHPRKVAKSKNRIKRATKRDALRRTQSYLLFRKRRIITAYVWRPRAAHPAVDVSRA